MGDTTEVKDRFSEFLRELETLESNEEGIEALEAQKPLRSGYW